MFLRNFTKTLAAFLLLIHGALFSGDAYLSDITYLNDRGRDFKLDLMSPPAASGRSPLVICFHGGGFVGGDKKEYSQRVRDLVKAGYAAATVNYGLAPDFKLQDQVRHAKTAVRFLKSHAAEYGIDPERVAVMGSSAGGYIALMTGLADDAAFLNNETAKAEGPDQVQAIVNYFGPTDFLALLDPKVLRQRTVPGGSSPLKNKSDEEVYNTPGLLSAAFPKNSPASMMSPAEVAECLSGSRDSASPLARKLSVVNWIAEREPPVLTLHGDQDRIVPVEQAKLLQKTIEEKHASGRLEIQPGKGHGWEGEAQANTWKIVLAFLAQTLSQTAGHTATSAK